MTQPPSGVGAGPGTSPSAPSPDGLLGGERQAAARRVPTAVSVATVQRAARQTGSRESTSSGSGGGGRRRPSPAARVRAGLGVANSCWYGGPQWAEMNLKEWARLQGIHPVTAYRWFRDGKLPVPARSESSPTGAPSACPWSANCGRRRTPAAWSACSAQARPGSSTPPSARDGDGCSSPSGASSRTIPVRRRPRSGPASISGSGPWPPSPTPAATSSKFPTPPPCGRRSQSAAGWGGSGPDAFPALGGTARRKPSSPASTVAASTCASRRPTGSPPGWRRPTARL